MMMKRRLLAAALIASAAFAAQAEDLTQALRDLLANALEVRFYVRLLPAEDDKPSWNVESKKLTIPGRSVNVRLDGDNVVVLLEVTPYVKDNGEVLLLAKGQVWFTEPPEKTARYMSAYYNIPLAYGEKALFFPLGFSDQQGSEDHLNLELEIVIVPYQQEAQTTAPGGK